MRYSHTYIDFGSSDKIDPSHFHRLSQLITLPDGTSAHLLTEGYTLPSQPVFLISDRHQISHNLVVSLLNNPQFDIVRDVIVLDFDHTSKPKLLSSFFTLLITFNSSRLMCSSNFPNNANSDVFSHCITSFDTFMTSFPVISLLFLEIQLF
ncbi:hypothetical protein GEMRC1_002042 [Eukaryota sp. GEM-RC1]